ncbi:MULTISPECIES: contact-dependent growth inhibition system immunity protein [Mycolicibacterium]|uniref:contact-dependent growth inhibition system immunity protein n=1 Tax=Mycolicibacterium TaxID=1866885 RepID=UPI0020CED76C|nr:contact-dependent growth inhibition system immunity protein [Mycolicibacterium sp. PAM1]
MSKELRHFFGAYFYEDWGLEAADWQRVVDSCVQDEEPSVDLLRSLIHEIDDVSARSAEPDLRRLVTRALGANYYPPAGIHLHRVGQAGRCAVAQACQRD